MLRCAECSCYDEIPESWIAVLAADPDDADVPGEVAAFCPVCAAREFGMTARAAERYT